MKRFLVGGALLSACIGTTPPTPLPQGDADAFVANVQPVLEDRCADPSCHGHVDRPFRVFGVLRERLDPTTTLPSDPLTAAELASNMRAFESFALDTVEAGQTLDECLILRKPLPPEELGAAHVGGVIFDSTYDRQWRAMYHWIFSLYPNGSAP